MKRSDLEALLKLLQRVTEEECENEEEDDDEGCELIESLNNDFQDYQNWLWGDNKSFSKKEAIKIWKKLHPKHPVPRVLQSEKEIDQKLRDIAVMFDAFPIYLAEKNKEE